jgi:hypothetical protein
MHHSNRQSLKYLNGYILQLFFIVGFVFFFGQLTVFAQVSNPLSISLLANGAAPNDLQDDTPAFENTIAQANDGDVIYIPKGIFIVRKLIINKNISFKGQAGYTIIQLIGKDSGFIYNSTNGYQHISFNDIIWKGSGQPSDNQYAFRPQSSAINGKHLSISNCQISDVTVGIDLTSCQYCKVSDCIIKTIVGENPGQGYGIAMGGTASHIVIENVTVENVQRHAIYVGTAFDVFIDKCIIKNHRKGLTLGGSLKGGIAISRVGQSVISNCFFIDCDDSPLSIDDDDQWNNRQLFNVTVSNCQFINNKYPIVIGEPYPSNNTSRGVNNIIITGCIWQGATDGHGTFVRLDNGNNIKISDCLLDFSKTIVNTTAFDVGGQIGTNTQNVDITQNTFIHNKVNKTQWKHFIYLRKDISESSSMSVVVVKNNTRLEGSNLSYMEGSGNQYLKIGD